MLYLVNMQCTPLDFILSQVNHDCQYCNYYVYVYIYICSCIPLHQLHPKTLNLSEYLDLFSFDSMIYKYTSEANLTKILKAVEIAEVYNRDYLYKIFSSECQYYFVIVAVTTGFIPCNLTSGTPKPLCSSDCYFFRQFCDDEYKMFITYAKLFGILISENYCENTFEAINKLFHYPNSSEDFQNDCFVLPGNV